MQIMAKTGSALALAMLAGMAVAQDVATLDTNADGAVSFPELIVAYPDLTEEGFSAMDSNGDGLLDAEELTAAVEGGLIAPTEG